MPFSVNILKETDYPVITLKDETSKCEAGIYAFGALLNNFSIETTKGKVNVIDGFTSPNDAIKHITAGFKSAKLSPFVCRLDKGEYSFEGGHHKVHKHYIFRLDKGEYSFEGGHHKVHKHYLGNEAIHGLIYDAMFEIADYKEEENKASVTLSYTYDNKEQGFPYKYNITVKYSLEKGNRLTVATTVTNSGNKNFPLSDGWHPYFSLGESVDDLTAQFNSGQMVEFDNRLLPTGNLLPYPAFEAQVKFGDIFLDNCFALKNFDQPSCILKDEKAGLQLTITADKSYPYLQVYTPPHRKSIAVENLSSPPDSFNNQIDLIIAKPGETYHFITAYQLTAL